MLSKKLAENYKIILKSGDLTRKKGLLHKSVGEDEIKGEHVKPVPGEENMKSFYDVNKMSLQGSCLQQHVCIEVHHTGNV